MKLEELPTDLLLLKFADIDTSPVEKMEAGAELRKRGAYPKPKVWSMPSWTPRYGSG